MSEDYLRQKREIQVVVVDLWSFDVPVVQWDNKDRGMVWRTRWKRVRKRIFDL